MTRQTFFAVKPPFVVDANSVVRNSGRQIDWANVPDKYRMGAVAVTLTAAANAAATALVFTALTGEIPAGSLLYFGEASEFARLAAKAAAGTTTVTVDALGTTIESGDVAYYGGTGAKSIPAGKVMVELTSGKLATRSDRPGSETAVGLLATNAFENSPSDALSGYGVIIGGVIYENLLPDATAGATTGSLTTAYKTEMMGSTSSPASTGFVFEQYADNRS